MKFFVAVLALAAMAVAEPEADPALFYSGLGYNYGLGYSGYHGLGYAGYTGLGYTGYHGLGYSRLGYAGLGYTGYPLAYSTVGTVAGPHGTYANSGGAVHITKRDAEADPAVFYSGLGYNYGLGYAGLGYSRFGYTGLGYAGLAHHATAYPYSNFYGAYAHGPRGYYANSGGAVHIAKRDAEADAEADPAYFYSRLGYNYAARPFAYARTYTHAYAPVATHVPYTYASRFYSHGYPYAGYGYFK